MVRSGEANRPAIWAKSTSRLGRSASALRSFMESGLPSTTPPFTISLGVSRAKSRRALATAETSPSTKAIAVGPTRNSASDSTSVPAIARRTSVFLKTL